MDKFIRKLYSSAPDASYGRVLSTLAFAVMVLGNLWIAWNPWGLLKAFTYVPQINQYLFYLALGGYSVTVLKEILGHIFPQASDSPDPK